MSSPGSGKTTLLERTIHDTAADLSISVIEGDQATLLDADRIKATGCRVVQVNTGAGCHLDADMVRRGTAIARSSGRIRRRRRERRQPGLPGALRPRRERPSRVMSVTEGDDKPRKYPHMFRTADLVLLNKVDLLPYVDFDVDKFAAAVHHLKPAADIRPVSATKGDGMGTWYEWLRTRRTLSLSG